MTNKSAPRAAFAAKPISPVMRDYVAWLKAETGYDVDPMSVQLSGVLRGAFQKSPGNQKRIAAASARVAAEKAARAERKAAQQAKAAESKPKPKPNKSAVKKATAAPRRRRPLQTSAAEQVTK
jgi:sRNA-binding protein